MRIRPKNPIEFLNKPLKKRKYNIRKSLCVTEWS